MSLLKDSVNKLLKLLNKKDKQKLILIFFMMIIAALFETLSIGVIVPFVSIVTSPETIKDQSVLSEIFKLFNFQSESSFIMFAVVLLILIFILKNMYILLYNYIQYRIVLNQEVKLSTTLFKEYLTKPYTFHLQRNTSELLRNVNNEVRTVFQGIVLSSLQLVTEILITICILVLLLVTAPIATLIAALLLGSGIFVFFKFFRRKISRLGKELQEINGEKIKWVNQGLGASKEVKVTGKETFFIQSYRKYSLIGVKNSQYMKVLDLMPRAFIETILVGTILITMLIIVLQGNNTIQLISTMALFAMSAFRLMPSITRIMTLITTIKYSQPALTVVFNDSLGIPNKSIDDLKIAIIKSEQFFKNSIELNHVSFQYPKQKSNAIENISLKIPIGSSIAFVGQSGSGKTTLVDIILGLLEPSKGQIYVDGKRLNDQLSIWQQKIGYIPQSIFLSDDTIRNNVAFGYEAKQIDDQEVWRALEQSHLKEFVQSLPEQLDTSVGERGVRLSGGQRQRIGIARALYHNPEIIFMDEATSALDNETEKEIMKAIDGLKGEKTLVIIAHRLSTIENCDIIYKINKGRLEETENRIKQSV